MKLAATVTAKVSRADKELSGAVTLMEDNPEDSPDASEWASLPTAIEDVTTHAKMLELMTLRRIALGLRTQILSEPNPRTVSTYKDYQPLLVDGAPVDRGYYVRLLARFNDADFDRLLHTYRQKKMKDLRKLFGWSAETQEPLDQNGELFIKTRHEELADWRASEAGKARRAIEAKKSSGREFTPREITSEITSSPNDLEDGEIPVSEVHEIVRDVIRGYRQANPDCPPFITVSRGNYFAQVFIEQATPDDLAGFVKYRLSQAEDMKKSADAAQKLLDHLTRSLAPSELQDIAA